MSEQQEASQEVPQENTAYDYREDSNYIDGSKEKDDLSAEEVELSKPKEPKEPEEVEPGESGIAESGEPGEPGEQVEQKERPWEKNADGTPKWLKNRFKKLSTQIHDLKSENESLKKRVPIEEEREMTEKDFPTVKDYLDYRDEQKAEAQAQESNQRPELTEEEKELEEAFDKNLLNAQELGEVPENFNEIISSAEPISLMQDTISHLYRSPVGPHVQMYLARNEDLAESLREMGPEKAHAKIAELHDEFLTHAIEQRNTGKNEPSEPQKEPVQQAPQAQRVVKKTVINKKSSIKAPPNTRGRTQPKLNYDPNGNNDDYYRKRSLGKE